MTEILKIIGRDEPLFQKDLARQGSIIDERVKAGRFLVIGGAGSIGSAVVRELFKRNPRVLHVVDVSENGLAEMVRNIRSTTGYNDGEFHAFCMDCLGSELPAMVKAQKGYDYVLNFSALKHVRSEKDPFTLMRMIDVNIFGTERTIDLAIKAGAKRFFCVSTDKASNPVNMMGASKRIMEMYLMRSSERIALSSARFANVAFSDGSLPHSWTQRVLKRQPISAPSDVKRYFVTDQEGALLCLFSTLLGENRDIFFPKLSEKLHLIPFSDMAVRYLQSMGYEPYMCQSEDEARAKCAELIPQKKWPCYFFKSDTTGEKDFEEFYTTKESVDWNQFDDIGVVKNDVSWNGARLDKFTNTIQRMKNEASWTKAELVDLFNQTLENFNHKETGRYLDGRM